MLRCLGRSSGRFQQSQLSLLLSSSSSSSSSSLLLPMVPRSTSPSTTTSMLNSVHSSVKRWHGTPTVSPDAETINITFCLADGTTEKVVSAVLGESLLQTAHRNDIDLEGACEGVCACSTCHVILPQNVYDNMLEEPSEDEEDMLDMAFGLTETSRLGCQITVTQQMESMVVQLPAATRNFYVDGHVPKPH